MYEIVKKKVLKENIILIEVKAPLVAMNSLPGQFIILRVNKHGERIPLTIFDKTSDTVSVIYQVVGVTTKWLSKLEVGEATTLENVKKAIVIGGGIGCAIAYPIAKKLMELNAKVHAIIGFRSVEQVILEEEFKNLNCDLTITTDDGSYGEKGVVTQPLKALLEKEQFDCVYAIGPLPMMKFVSLTTKEFNVKTIVSMNSIMVDGTGMCGGCRVTVDGKMKFACVDGPDFDGHLVDFDEAIKRNRIYQDIEKRKYEKTCRLLGEDHE